MLACHGGHVGVVEVLLAAGARGDHVGRCNATALLLAARGGHVGVVSTLLECKLDVDCGGLDITESSLIAACARGYVDVARLLISAGA